MVGPSANPEEQANTTFCQASNCHQSDEPSTSFLVDDATTYRAYREHAVLLPRNAWAVARGDQLRSRSRHRDGVSPVRARNMMLNADNAFQVVLR